MSLQESGEMYLETIYRLSKDNAAVRSIDVADAMNYSKPSVSRAVGILKKGGYIETDSNGYLLLTDKGRKAAEKTYERHQVLTDFFTSIGVDREIAAEDACRIEHVISDTAFNAMKAHINKS